MPTNFSGPMLPSPTTPKVEGEWSTTWSHSKPVLLSPTMPEAVEDSEAAGEWTLANPELAELQEEDYYIKYRKFTCHLEILDLQESYIKDEQANLKCEPIWVQEVKHIQSVPLVISQFLRPIDHLTGIHFNIFWDGHSEAQDQRGGQNPS
ncbi:hypothetical protein BS47DRAFT_1364740 [Hydnum rufescens UP504]|uniref:Uncharacterized protein n=1 Tax=Hydnum rufescens UP504 TaxID=1448309 RepID=A0A9P6AFA4_9AGAM|nr:hypothetical protein BS47DRAFT_1369012 [Hydnum rufescens UP504]KAF9510199.1 hypothetical protein BS47DRAFT_1364740 [Hydnum rufescens UP504]